MRPCMSKTRIPVDMEFSMARLNPVSASSAASAWVRNRVYRQRASKLNTMTSDRANTTIISRC